MSMSGVKTSEDVVQSFEEMKMKHNIKYMILNIKDDKEVVVEKKKMQCDCPDYNVTYQEFQDDLQDEPRYAVYDYQLSQSQEEGQQSDSGKRPTCDKLLLVSWNPENSKVKQRMVFASTKNGLKDKLKGVHGDLTTSDKCDFATDHVESILRKK